MKQLRITRCSDPQLWYAGLVGELVIHIGDNDQHYLSREPKGYVNIIRREDAEVVGE